MEKKPYTGVWRKLNPRSKQWYALVSSCDYIDQDGNRITPVAGDDVVITKKNGATELYTLVRNVKYGEYRAETMWSPAFRQDYWEVTKKEI